MPVKYGLSKAGWFTTLVCECRNSSMKPVADDALVVEAVHDRVVPEGRPALVHDLGLALRVEVLPELAHDAHDLALPRLQQRRVLLDEIEDVLLRLGREARRCARGGLVAPVRDRAPQVVDLGLQEVLALLLAAPLLAQPDRGRALVAVHPVVHQRVAGIEQQLDLELAVALLALGDVVAGEHQVVDDGVGVGPGAEQVVAT